MANYVGPVAIVAYVTAGLIILVTLGDSFTDAINPRLAQLMWDFSGSWAELG